MGGKGGGFADSELLCTDSAGVVLRCFMVFASGRGGSSSGREEARSFGVIRCDQSRLGAIGGSNSLLHRPA